MGKRRTGGFNKKRKCRHYAPSQMVGSGYKKKEVVIQTKPGVVRLPLERIDPSITMRRG
jgi:hypothetical protein